MIYKVYGRSSDGSWQTIGEGSLTQAVALMAAYIESWPQEMKINSPNGRTVVRYDPYIDLSRV